jgi:radical SAM superfamily enzyme YgiQ (UPF0313 family)
MNVDDSYQGFELGPIRPPSEANSLLLRITRNCPWNKCTFCGLYKGEKFSIRSVDDIRKDIDRVHYFVNEITKVGHGSGGDTSSLASLQAGLTHADQMAFHAALTFMRGHAERALVAHRVTPDNVERWAAEMMQRFI